MEIVSTSLIVQTQSKVCISTFLQRQISWVLQTRNRVEENQSSKLSQWVRANNLPPKLERGIFDVKSGQIKGSCDDVFAKKGGMYGGVKFLFPCSRLTKREQDLGSFILNLWGIHTPKEISKPSILGWVRVQSMLVPRPTWHENSGTQSTLTTVYNRCPSPHGNHQIIILVSSS